MLHIRDGKNLFLVTFVIHVIRIQHNSWWSIRFSFLLVFGGNKQVLVQPQILLRTDIYMIRYILHYYYLHLTIFVTYILLQKYIGIGVESWIQRSDSELRTNLKTFSFNLSKCFLQKSWQCTVIKIWFRWINIFPQNI